MANNFVKWWKTKFLNGYKQFSAESNYGKISDTEELLESGCQESDAEERLRTACTTPPMESQNSSSYHPHEANTQTSPTQPQQHLNLEEFSCDVSVEGGVDKTGQERQEFSFTLYDFDGYGKITKDDIAGLVTTIYEALGSSVKVPHYGSKTIRVKLTVSPDQRKHVSATVINQKETKTDDKTEPNTRVKRDLNVTIRQGNKHCRRIHKERETIRHHCCGSVVDQDDCLIISDDSSDVCSNASGEVTSEDEGGCTDHYICNKVRQKRYHKKLHRHTFPKDVNTNNQQESCSKSEKQQKRSSSLQRQELLEIIQANMNKNNLGLQTTRKHSNNYINFETKHSQRNETRQQKRHKAHMPTLQYLANIMDPTHFYVDLASFQNATQLSNTNCQYNKLIDAVMCVSSKKVPVKKAQGCRKHNRIKTHDYTNIPLRCHLLTAQAQTGENATHKTTKKSTVKNAEVEQGKSVKKNVKKIPQIVLGNTSSPHYLRHRNRQEDQARAMAQVVRWLEQEFSSNFYTGDQNHKNDFRSTNFEKQPNNAPPSPNSSVERHEHHHVHEHIHHHYHHYQETPIVV